eukprot:TRINITY_DN60987_c0_g1_i1.p1 TRINITY_DN60987_c0_g1~~TRINITY_DN60987_c0_g1_i1.p1  ORF type:complete len:493 (+),score=74.38 TRINITY_DN60987_c0_g1_i1:95-1573(+)
MRNHGRHLQEPCFALKVGPISWYCLWNSDASEAATQLSDFDNSEHCQREDSALLDEALGRRHLAEDHPGTWFSQHSSRLAACGVLVFLLALLGIVSWQREVQEAHVHALNMEQVVGGVAAAWAVIRSCMQVYWHQRCNTSALRRCTLRILWIVPIFALDAWVCLLVQGDRRRWVMLLACAREVYEAIGLCSFLQLILAFLGGPIELSNTLLDCGQDEVEHFGLLRHCLPAYRPGPSFVSKVVVGVLQYAVVTPCLFGITCILWGSLQDPDLTHFQEGLLRLKTLPPILKALSCVCAMYHIALLYRETFTLLHQLHPVLKFVGIKGIIFFTFWQGFIVDALFLGNKDGYVPLFGSQPGLSKEDAAESFKSFLLCLEMPFFSEIHKCAYPHDEWEHSQSLSGHSSAAGQLHRDSDGAWRMTEDSPAQAVIVHQEDETNPWVSRIASLDEGVPGSIKALHPQDLIDLWGEVQELTERARNQRGVRAADVSDSAAS